MHGDCLYHPLLSQIMCEYSSEVNVGQGLFPNRVWMRLPYTGATGKGRVSSVALTGAVPLALGARKKDIYS